MKVRCKFKVDSVQPDAEGLTTLHASAVTSRTPENDIFWKYTPSGQLSFGCIHGESVKHLKPGTEIYIDITVAEPEAIK